MKISIWVASVFAIMPSLVLAGERLELAHVRRIGDGPYIEILIDGTMKGREIVCALYLDRELQAVDTQIANSLATRVLINFEGNIDSARCVYND